MARPVIQPTGNEITWDPVDIIVSKTDKKGILTYANNVFVDVSGYSRNELIGQPHNILRHPDMPRCVFKLLWDTIESGHEIFAYVLNMAKNGDHYWVLAHVTPSFDEDHNIIGYHSNRRVPRQEAVDIFAAVYKDLLAEEQKYDSPKEGMKASVEMLHGVLAQKDMAYDQLVLAV